MTHSRRLLLLVCSCLVFGVGSAALAEVSLSGTVTDTAGAPIEGASIRIESGEPEFYFVDTSTDSAGEWTATFPSGSTFYVEAERSEYLAQLWQGIECGLQSSCNIFDGDPVVLADGESRTGIDFQLSRGGRISGSVISAATGEPIDGASVEVVDRATGYTVGYGTTDDAGLWAVSGLAVGTYVAAVGKYDERFEGQLWNGIACQSFCPIEEGDPIVLGFEEEREGIDFRVLRSGQIRGRVLTPAGDPIAFATVVLFGETGGTADFFSSDVDGSWTSGPLQPGTYYVGAADLGPLHGVVYPAVPCQIPTVYYSAPTGCDVTDGQSIRIDTEVFVEGVDLRLFLGGSIEGTVTQPSGAPLREARVSVLFDDPARSGQLVREAVTDVLGAYRVEGLVETPYLVFAEKSDPTDPLTTYFTKELYDDVPCWLSLCDYDLATRVSASQGEVVSGVDFRLEQRTGRIAGTVEAADGLNFWAEVRIYTLDGLLRDRVFVSTPDPTFAFFNLPTLPLVVVANLGRGEVVAWPDRSLPSTFFDGVDQPLDFPSDIPTVTLAVGEERTDIDFVLRPLPTVEGSVFDRTTGEPLSRPLYITTEGAGARYAGVDSGAEGRFKLTAPGVVPFVLGVDGGQLFGDQAWPQKDCFVDPTFGIHCASEPTELFLEYEEERTANFPLDPTAWFGVGFASDGGFIQGGQRLVLYDAERRPVLGSTQPANRLSGIHPGTYWIVASANRHYERVVGGASCRPRCDLTPEAAIVVTGTDPIPLTATLEACNGPCEQSGTLAVQSGRFEVVVQYRTATGETGEAVAVPLTDDSGYFWFFRDTNIELVVKVLDACVAPFDRFWVFAAGLTDVEVDLLVRDTAKGVRKTYRSTLGEPFQPILDTDAFATCSAGAAESDPAAALAESLAPTSVSPLPDAFFFDREDLDGLKDGDCTPGAEALCLQQQRFRVEITWETADASGTGQAKTLTSDTGYFWFFSEDNVEVVVKVLDACQPGFDRFWVFAAGLTDVEATLRVTDTVTGDIREYKNTLGEPFQPILDTDAFATCGADGSTGS